MVYGEPEEFDALCLYTNIPSSEKIFECGFSLDNGNELLTFNNKFNMDVTGIITLHPAKVKDRNGSSNKVRFSLCDLKFFALRKFYFLELQHGEIFSTLRVLVSKILYPQLKKFNPFLETKAPFKTGTLPLVFFKGKWFQYTTISSLHENRKNLKIELVMDSIPQYTSIYCDYLHTESDSLLDIFLFFALVTKHRGNSSVVYCGDKLSLYNLLSAIHQCKCDTGEVNTQPYIGKIESVDSSLFSINFAKAFDTGIIQSKDINHINAMDLIFLKSKSVPHPLTMISAITRSVSEMSKKEKSFQDIFGIFLQHFLTQEAKLTVKANLIAYLGGL